MATISKGILMLSLFLALALTTNCGTERWAVKTLTDKEVTKVNTQEIKKTTVEELRALHAPKYNDLNLRAPAEKTIYSIRVKLVGFKLEADQDFHVVVAGDTGATMIVEFPEPTCSGNSKFLAQMKATRKAFVEKYGMPTKKFKRLDPQPVIVITGVGFFDKIHGQTGVAPNGIELHPILGVLP